MQGISFSISRKKWIACLALTIAVFSVMSTTISANPAHATINVPARQKAAAVMNLIDQSLGYYENATGSQYVEREHLPTSANVTGTTGTNMSFLANATNIGSQTQPIVSQADYQIAQGLADKGLVIFVRTAPLTGTNNDPQAILSALSGLVALKTAIDNHAPYNVVEDIMASPIDRDMEKAFQTS
jgi:hypothetical protein